MLIKIWQSLFLFPFPESKLNTQSGSLQFSSYLKYESAYPALSTGQYKETGPIFFPLKKIAVYEFLHQA